MLIFSLIFFLTCWCPYHQLNFSKLTIFRFKTDAVLDPWSPKCYLSFGFPTKHAFLISPLCLLHELPSYLPFNFIEDYRLCISLLRKVLRSSHHVLHLRSEYSPRYHMFIYMPTYIMTFKVPEYAAEGKSYVTSFQVDERIWRIEYRLYLHKV
jgi:hypothetical protein